MMGGRSAHSLLHLLYYSFIPVSSPRSSLSAWVFILPPASFCFRESKLLRKHAPLLRRPMAARRVQGLDFITESFHSVCRLFPVELERKKKHWPFPFPITADTGCFAQRNARRKRALAVARRWKKQIRWNYNDKGHSRLLRGSTAELPAWGIMLKEIGYKGQFHSMYLGEIREIRHRL